ncbi:hypothetical protein [Halomonas stenophila]|uniref:Gamma-glutamylcyclotransferase n=1 Tax=Halomonas stenophila TaxID=795312 RepID=A0A7W5HMN7_9GAMM|nr:hypothetical protein [Halomonas stenophila]MBB3232779.1 hypothetical protein [Halomonas stenophila]
MSRVGILAYGSLIEDPGKELAPLISERRPRVRTPFSIEFARSSPTRDGAPTVVPVESGGCPVDGALLVLEVGVSLATAKDMLWRRETRNEASGKRYSPPARPHPDQMVVERLSRFQGIEVVLYARFGANLTDPGAATLADLAIQSARAGAGRIGRDGISYLMSLKQQGITTPLMPGYEREILRRTGASSLEEAWSRCRRGLV